MVTLLDSDQGQGLGFSFHFSKEFWANVVTCCNGYFGSIRSSLHVHLFMEVRLYDGNKITQGKGIMSF